MPDTPPPDNPFAARCTPGGVYSSCFERFSTASDCLAQLTFIKDFYDETTAWSQTSDSFTMRFLCPISSDELTVTLFGEVLDETNSTGLGAMGSLSLKRGQVGQSPSDICHC